MENRAQKILHNLKSCLTHCSTISNITSDLNNPYLITSPRNFISGSKITSPIKINLTKRHQNLNNYFIESQFAKTNSLSKNILSPKNKSHRTLSHYNTQPNQSYSTNNIDNYTSNCDFNLHYPNKEKIFVIPSLFIPFLSLMNII